MFIVDICDVTKHNLTLQLKLKPLASTFIVKQTSAHSTRLASLIEKPQAAL